MNAESAYLFRHALLRDAAYQLQMPADRARLHGFVVQILEGLFGGRPDRPEPFSAREGHLAAHPLDPLAAEIALHAQIAASIEGPTRDWFEEARRSYLHRAAVFAQASYQHASAAGLWRELAELVKGSERGQALQQAAECRRQSSGMAGVEELCCLALAESRTAGDKLREAQLLLRLAVIPVLNGDFGRAETELEHVLSMFKAVGERLGQIRVMHHFAFVHFERGDLEKAAQTLETAINEYRLLGADENEANAIGFLANIRGLQGHNEAWEAGQLRALEMARSSGSSKSLATALGSLAQVYWDTHRPELALAASEQAQAIWRGIGDLRSLGIELAWFATLVLAQGQVEAARTAWRDGAEILRSIGDVQSLEQRNNEMRQACEKAGILDFEIF